MAHNQPRNMNPIWKRPRRNNVAIPKDDGRLKYSFIITIMHFFQSSVKKH